MLTKASSKIFDASMKEFVVNIVLVANAFIWYFYAFNLLTGMGNNDAPLIIWGINFLGIAASAIFSTYFIEKFKQRLSFLRYWMLAGIFISLTPLAINTSPFANIVIAAILGVYFGFGMPICMGYFAATIETGKRARLSGITFLFIALGLFLFSNIGIEDVTFAALILVSLRAAGLIIIVFLKPNEKPIEKTGGISYRSVFSNRVFLLYFVPWVMFSLVNDITFAVKGNFFTADFAYYSGIVGNVLAGIFAVIGGFIADFMGRKRLAVTGFALLGLGYAVLGFSSEGNLFGWWFYTVVDGIAWGAFYTIFLLTLWGDLANEKGSEKYYALGSLPYLLSNFLRISLGDYIADGIPTYAVFSFASLFLFLAVLPLIYAPETLPEKRIKDRELKSYVEKAQKIAQKESDRSQKNEIKKKQERSDASEEENNENSEEYNEARKLAEKYY